MATHIRFRWVVAVLSASLSIVLTDCLLASPVYLLKETESGFLLCHAAEGYVGYVAAGDIHRADAEEFTRYLNGPRVYVRKDCKLPDDRVIPVSCWLKCVERQPGNVVVEMAAGEKTVVPNDCCEVHDGRRDSRMERVLENANRVLGTRYLWGGKTSQGIDCSGLVQVAFAAEGINLPRDSNQQVYLGSLVATRWNLPLIGVIALAIGTQTGATASIGLPNVHSSLFGGSSGFLSDLSTGGSQSLQDGETATALQIADDALAQVTNFQARVGSFESTTLDSAENHLTSLQENLADAINVVEDADEAQELALQTKNQLLADYAMQGLVMAAAGFLNPATLVSLIDAA